MNDDLDRLLRLVDRAQAAWDQYTFQRRLPDRAGWPQRGFAYDPSGDGRGGSLAARDPRAVSAAWNDLEGSLIDLSVVAARVRDARGGSPAAAGDRAWYDVRTTAVRPMPPPIQEVAATGRSVPHGARVPATAAP